jgi:hypothetical protein
MNAVLKLQPDRNEILHGACPERGEGPRITSRGNIVAPA